jgi:salicylate hydroxylase
MSTQTRLYLEDHLNSDADFLQEPENGRITLTDGTTVSGHLIIAADGVHSKAVEAILGAPNQALPTTNYNFAYRFLIPTKDIASDPETVQFTEDDDGTMKFFIGKDNRLVWYPCRK